MSLCHKLKSLEPDGINLRYFKFRLFNTGLGIQLCLDSKSYLRRLPALKRFNQETKCSLL